jgi:hypothetical protein
MHKKYFLIIGIIAFMGIILISGCIKQDDNTKEWIEISIFCQCCEEPWKNDINIKSFFEDKKINIYDVKIKSRGPVCEECSCPSYKIKEILVDSINKEKVLEILNSYNSQIS